MEQTAKKHGTVALDDLREYRQWVAWEYKDKRKIPIDPHTWRAARTDNPDTWGTYEEALAASVNGQVGFVLVEQDDFTFIDLDKCVSLETGEVAPSALEIVEELGSYTELSPSRTGLHILVRGHKPTNDRCSTPYADGKVEVYDRDRFLTFTGQKFCGHHIEERQEQLERIYYRLFPPTDNEGINTVGVESGLHLADSELLEKARNSGNGKNFIALYDYGNTSKYKSQSEADMALCGMLAFWTACDDEQMDRLFRDSKLHRRKWDEHRTYSADTIAKAIKNCTNVYDPANFKAQATDDVRRTLEDSMELAVAGKWSGRSGPTDRSVYRALINTGLEYGKAVADGVEVSVSQRDLALKAGIARKATVGDALRRLEARRLARKLADGVKGRSARYLLLTQNRTINNRVNKNGTLLRQTQRIRNPSRYYDTIGKRPAHILEYIHSLQRVATKVEVAKRFGIRQYDLESRYISKLLEQELLKRKDEGYVTPADLEDRLERILEESGMALAERLQAKQYELEREVYRSPKVITDRERQLQQEIKGLREQRENRLTHSTVLITDEFPDTERDYLREDERCIHGIRELCYLHNPNHPYRLKEKQEIAA